MTSEIEEYRRLVHMVRCYVEKETRLSGNSPLVPGIEKLKLKPPENKANLISSQNTKPAVNNQLPKTARAMESNASTAMTERQHQLQELADAAATCCKCKLAHQRRQVVFGAGSATAKLVIVGEAPGYHEDMQGIPFVGESGQLLTKMLAAIGLTREQIYICNVIKCRPPGNRNPDDNEIIACRYWLTRQLQLVQPKTLCAMGKFAAQTLTGLMQPMWKFRGNIYHYEGIPLLCTYHPAYLLRNSEDKRKSWQDLLALKELMEK